MKFEELSAKQINCLAIAITEILTKDATVKDLELLLQLLTILRDEVTLYLYILRNK